MLDSEFIIQVDKAEIYQKQIHILKQISFYISKGEFVYLVGRTGSGKSSLLRTLYADLPLRKGSIHIAGHQIKDISRQEIPMLRRKIGIIFQDFQLFYDRTVAENLLFVMRATGWKDSYKMKNRSAEVLMQVGLSGASVKMPHELSGGEQQRLAIARSLINEPLILIADEPTGNLDPEVSTDILQLFLKINKSGTSVLMATHNHHLLKNYPARTLKCGYGKLTEVTDLNDLNL